MYDINLLLQQINQQELFEEEQEYEQQQQQDEGRKNKIKRFTRNIEVIPEIPYPFSVDQISYQVRLFTDSENAVNRRFNTLILRNINEMIEGKEAEEREEQEEMGEQQGWMSFDLTNEKKRVIYHLLSLKGNEWMDINLYEFPRWHNYADLYRATRSDRAIAMMNDTIAGKLNGRKLFLPPNDVELLTNIRNESYVFRCLLRSQNIKYRDRNQKQYSTQCNKIGTKFFCQCKDYIKNSVAYEIYDTIKQPTRVWNDRTREFEMIYPISTVMPCKHIRFLYVFLNIVDVEGIRERIRNKTAITNNEINNNSGNNTTIIEKAKKRKSMFLSEYFQTYTSSNGYARTIFNKNERSRIKFLKAIFHQESIYNPVHILSSSKKNVSASQLYMGEKIQGKNLSESIRLFKSEGMTKRKFFETLLDHYGWTEWERAQFILKFLEIYIQPTNKVNNKMNLDRTTTLINRTVKKKLQYKYYVPVVETHSLQYRLNNKKGKKKDVSNFKIYAQKVLLSEKLISCDCLVYRKGILRYCEHIIALFGHLNNKLSRGQVGMIEGWIRLNNLCLQDNESFSVLTNEEEMMNEIVNSNEKFEIMENVQSIYYDIILPKMENQLLKEYKKNLKNKESLVYLKSIDYQKVYYANRLNVRFELHGNIFFSLEESKRKRGKEGTNKTNQNGSSNNNNKKQKRLSFF